METAAIPLLTAIILAAPPDRYDTNAFIIRKDCKTTGLGNAIEGLVTGDPIVLVDDIMNSGSSAEKARVVLERCGNRPTSLFVVIDYRSAAGMAWRERHGIQVHALFDLTDFDLRLKPAKGSQKQAYRQIWRTSVPGAFPYHVVPKSAPVLAGARLYRGSDDGTMHAFDVETGTIAWTHRATGAAAKKGIWSTPAVYANHLYYGAYNGVV